jgi:outer membrane immunogenic protein
MAIKSFVRGATLIAVSGLSAFAADMPMSSPEPTELPVLSGPAFDWTGFYVGANGGFGWANGGNIRIDDPINGPFAIGVKSGTGFIGGAQVGWNLQSDVLVSGIEADLQYASIRSSVNWGPYGFLGVSSGARAEYFGTLRVRSGFTVDGMFFFLTGGLAYGGLNSSPLGGAARLNVGYALGAGVEYAFADHWTTKVEALYINVGNSNSRTTSITNGGNVYPITAFSGNGGGLIRVGLNYKF